MILTWLLAPTYNFLSVGRRSFGLSTTYSCHILILLPLTCRMASPAYSAGSVGSYVSVMPLHELQLKFQNEPWLGPILARVIYTCYLITSWKSAMMLVKKFCWPIPVIYMFLVLGWGLVLQGVPWLCKTTNLLKKWKISRASWNFLINKGVYLSHFILINLHY